MSLPGRAGGLIALAVAAAAVAAGGPGCTLCDQCPVAVYALTVTGVADGGYEGTVAVDAQTYDVSCPGSVQPYQDRGWTCASGTLSLFASPTAPAPTAATVDLTAGERGFAGEVALTGRTDQQACGCATYDGEVALQAP